MYCLENRDYNASGSKLEAVQSMFLVTWVVIAMAVNIVLRTHMPTGWYECLQYIVCCIVNVLQRRKNTVAHGLRVRANCTSRWIDVVLLFS